MRRSAVIGVLAIGLSLGSAGCRWPWRKAPAPQVPQAPVPTPTVKKPMPPPPKASKPAPKPDLEPPVLQPAPPDIQVIRPQLPPMEPPKTEPPKQPAKKRAPRTVEAAKPVPPPAPAVTAPPPVTEPAPAEVKPAEPAPAPAPVLGEIVSPEQRQAYERTIAESTAAAQRILNSLGDRKLTRTQQETASRVRAFLGQADEAKASDPSLAAQLARRAALLAEDLEKSLN